MITMITDGFLSVVSIAAVAINSIDCCHYYMTGNKAWPAEELIPWNKLILFILYYFYCSGGGPGALGVQESKGERGVSAVFLS